MQWQRKRKRDRGRMRGKEEEGQTEFEMHTQGHTHNGCNLIVIMEGRSKNVSFYRHIDTLGSQYRFFF